METKIHNPSFTVSLRGYDREEVDEYLDSLVDALDKVDGAEEQTRRLQAHIVRLTGRVKELEDRLRTETPRTGLALGERIGMLLREAEDAAAETVAHAEIEAARVRTAADERAAEAEEIVRSATARANEQARRTEAAARAESAEILAEAEARATARTRQIEQWAEQVISHTRAEEARMLNQQQTTRDAFDVELKGLDKQRAAARRTLVELRDALGRALTITEPPAGADEASEPEAAAIDLDAESEGSGLLAIAADSEDASPAPHDGTDHAAHIGDIAVSDSSDAGAADHTDDGSDTGDSGGIELRYSGVDDFEEKLEAWVNDGKEDDRRS